MLRIRHVLALAFFALSPLSATMIIGVDFNVGIHQNEIRTLDPASGLTTLLNTISFGGFNSATFALDVANGRFYEQAGDGNLYRFDLATGNLISITPADTTMGALAVRSDGSL